MKSCKLLIFFLILICHPIFGQALDSLTLSDVDNMYKDSKEYFKTENIDITKESRGVKLEFEYEFKVCKYDKLNSTICDNISKIEYFLSKIKNPVIIEVHADMFDTDNISVFRTWEVSTVIANNIELLLSKPCGGLDNKRIKSVGYGKFSSKKNTSNNGGNCLIRVDIIILCSISGE